ncbi:chromosome segregation protein Spc25-domain-containing protein [Dichotomocladium elegans]|nr:chromosome segregation protein Spc25-domain-containing protein [Dichotomocladium elegans]
MNDNLSWKATSSQISIIDLKPKIAAVSEHLDAVIRSRIRAFDASNENIRNQAEQHKEHMQHLKDEIAKKKKLLAIREQQLPMVGEKATQLLEKVDALRERKQEENHRQEKVSRECDRLRDLVRRNKSDAEAKQKLSHEWREQLNMELELIAESLRMEVMGMGDYKTRFEFTHIHEREHKRKYYFTLCLTPGEPFQVPECVPEVQGLQTLLTQLNKDRDMYSFIIQMRQEFVKHAKNETKISRN